MKAASIRRAAAILFFTVLITSQTFNTAKAQNNGNNGHNGNNGNKGKSASELAIRVFLDHVWNSSHIKREIPFVNYVMDPKQAQVYILQTHQSTGSGGSEFTLTFVGQENFSGVNDTLQCFTGADATSHEERESVVNLMKMGLIRYISRTPFADNIDIRYTAESTEQTTTDVSDKWNFWSFRARVGASYNGDDSYKNIRTNGSFSANRVTEDWKMTFYYSGSYRENRTEYTSDSVLYKTKYIRRSHYLNSLIVKSITDHWSTGIISDVESATYYNIRFSGSIYPALEYNIFPYEESTRRQIVFLLSAGAEYVEYDEETIYLKTRETLYKASLGVSANIQEKWGSIYSYLEGVSYLNNTDFSRLNLNGGFNFRIVKGLEFNVHGSVSRIRDQLSIRKGEATIEDLLERRYELKSNWDYYVNFGLTFRFGSMYNNIVNPRFNHH
ncbi:MAG: hypothetical protein GY863_10640 [bacterium]|nr:hypothetical protein [bacterium]